METTEDINSDELSSVFLSPQTLKFSRYHILCCCHAIKRFIWDNEDNFNIIFGCFCIILSIIVFGNYPIICFLIALVSLGQISRGISDKCLQALEDTQKDMDFQVENLKTDIPVILAYYQSKYKKENGPTLNAISVRGMNLTEKYLRRDEPERLSGIKRVSSFLKKERPSKSRVNVKNRIRSL